MAISFSELWEQCESAHLPNIGNEDLSMILTELDLKVNLYKAINEKITDPSPENNHIKARALGEILFTITKLSLKEDINVYAALQMTMQSRQH